MAADETRVTYKAIANFIALHKAALAARKDLESIRKEEAKTNAASVAGSNKTAAAHRDATKALRSRTTSTKTATAAILAHNKALKDNLSLTKSTGTAAQTAAAKIKVASSVIKDATKETTALGDARKKVVFVANEVAAGEKAVSNAVDKTSKTLSNGETRAKAFTQKLALLSQEGKKLLPTLNRVANGTTSVNNVFKKLGNFRPHLIPPFIALVPIIAGLLSLLNPFVAILGAAGAAGFGAGAGILSLGGAALAIIPMVSAASAAVAGLLVAFKGIGGVFSKYSAAQKAAGGGGGGGGGMSAADQAFNLMKAEEGLSDAQENAKDAQDALNDAREQAVKDLAALHKAVTQDVLDEADAAAALQQATEDYYNTMADPGSTLGDKMAATANLNDAQQALSDSQQQSVDDQNALNDAQAAGVDGDKNVIAAQKQLRDALRQVRDAQHALNDQVNGGGSGGGGGVGAMDQFRAALAKLSPSAQKVVLALIAMQGAWENVQRSVQEAFFSKIVGDMGALAGFLPTIANLLTKAAGAMGTFAHNFIMLITSPKWTGDLNIISDQNVKLIDLAGDAVLNLLDALKDIVIAAGPFAVALVGSFDKLTKSFAGIVANARETGSLAKWLDLVYSRLQQWWRIIKNVAMTLFNYGAASADFGKWITDGLEKSTQNWLAASEEAKKKGSPFQDWLERLKPLLSEMKGLFGDFFGWLSKTAMDNDSITNATNIISSIRKKLGPALADLFNSLNTSGIGQDFVDTVSAIVSSISEIVKAGGASGFKTFFSVIKSFFEFLAKAFKDPVWGPGIKTFAEFAGAMTALSFIGKFTGIFSLFGWILKLSKSAAVVKLLAGIGSIGKVGKAAGAAASAGALTGGADAGAAAAAAAAAKSKIGRGRALGAAGAVLGVVDQVNTSLHPQKATISNINSKKQRKGLENQVIGGAIRGGASGALAGGSIGSFIPGVGTAVGATVGGAAGAVNGAISAGGGVDNLSKGLKQAVKDPKQFEGIQKTIAEDLFGKGFLADIITNAGKALVELFIVLPKNIGTAAKTLWDALPKLKDWLADRGKDFTTWITGLPKSVTKSIGDFWTKTIPDVLVWLQARGKDFGTWLTVDLPFSLGKLTGQFWFHILPDALTWLAARGTDFVNWLIGLPASLLGPGSGLWGALPGIVTWLAARGVDIYNWVVGLPGAVGKWAAGLWASLPGILAWLGARATDIYRWIIGLPATIGSWAAGLWKSLPGIGSWLSGISTSIYTWAIGLPSKVAGWIGNLFSKVVGNFTAGVNVGKKGAIGGLVGGQYFDSGGTVRKLSQRGVNMDPKGTDTEAAMLTPGEYVVKKERVDEVGAGNMQAFNDGMLSFAALMSKKKDGKGQGVGYFDGGGLAGSPINTSAISSGVKTASMSQVLTDNSMHFGDIIVNYPKRETASDSLPSALRKVSQSAGRRKPSPRLEKVGP